MQYIENNNQQNNNPYQFNQGQSQQYNQQQQFQQGNQQQGIYQNQFQYPVTQPSQIQKNIANNHNQGVVGIDQFDQENQHQFYKDDDYSDNEFDYQGQELSSLSSKARVMFIRKVYGILLTQIIITAIFVQQSIYNHTFQQFIQENIAFLYFILAVSLITCIALSCYKSVARQVPTNYIILLVFTLCESYLVSYTTSYYPGKIVLTASVITVAMFLGLTVYSYYTKTDFTVLGGMLFVALSVIVGATFLMLFIRSNIFSLLISIAGVFLFSIYLIFDTQLLFGNNKYAYTYDDYIMAALQIYLDLVNLFIYVLQILGDN